MSSKTKYINKLKDAKVLLIGGSSGIGFAVAAALVEYGAVVAIASSRESRIKDAIASLKVIDGTHNQNVSGHVCDLSNPDTVEENIKTLFAKSGKIDHVIMTAGDALAMVPVDNLSKDVIYQGGQVRFIAPLLVAKHAAHYLPKSSKSSITFTGGVVSDKPIPGWTLVSAFAAGIEGVTRGLAIDLKPIRVNVVRPGMTDTNLYAASGIPDEMKQGIFADGAQKLPLGKVGRPEDLAEAYLYLMKDENVTGEVLNSNGGQLLV